MAGNEKKTNEETTKSTVTSGPRKSSSTTKVSVAKARFPARERTYSFEQWAKRRGVPSHHKGGLRAYVTDVEVPRSLEAWDNCFADY